MARELAQMREQMAAMASRIDTLEAQLQVAKANGQPARAVESAVVATETDMAEPTTKISFKGAPEISGKGGWSFKPRGRLQFDTGFIDAPDAALRPEGFGSEVRRARLGVQGEMPGGFGYKFEVDFAGNEVALTDGILTYSNGPATLTVGQHNTFQGLEELTSSLHTSFIERAAFTDAFGFERRLGASVQYAKGPVLAQAGVFSDNVDALSNRNRGADARFVYMPKIGGTQLHVGGSIHHADLEALSTVRYRHRPLVHFTSQRFVDTNILQAESETGYGVEAAAIGGRFHVAAEQYWQHLNRPGALSDPTFSGGYAEIGYFLTSGDSRGYKGGTFDRVKPKRPIGKGGPGAIQVNLRYDWLDLIDAGIVGGTQDGYQIGVTWTPTDYTRLMVNYGRMQYDDAIYPAAGGDRSYGVGAIGMRAQIDF
jgi:phosphate-selective porin OprO/OprP